MNTQLTERAKLVNLILKGIAVAMGVAVVVLNLIGAPGVQASLTMLGLGLACLAVAALNP